MALLSILEERPESCFVHYMYLAEGIVRCLDLCSLMMVPIQLHVNLVWKFEFQKCIDLP